MAKRRGVALSALVAAYDAGRAPIEPLASCLRVAALIESDPELRKTD